MPSQLNSTLPGCKRLCLSYIVDMSGDRDEPSLLEIGFGERANDLLDEMRKKGMQDSIMRTLVEWAIRKDDVEGLKHLLASLRKKVATHDADQSTARRYHNTTAFIGKSGLQRWRQTTSNCPGTGRVAN